MDNDIENNIELRVLLLALYKKTDDETFSDILGVMENSKVFTKKVGKKYLKILKDLKLIDGEGFTFLGIQKAKEVESEFKL